MRTLGLSFDFHDSSVALVENGKLIHACAEERLTRQKHDSHFPLFAIREALKACSLNINDIDEIAFYENPEQKFSRLIEMNLKVWPTAVKEFRAMISAWLGSKLWTKSRIAQKLNVDPKKIKILDHHLSHAYQGFVGSNFENAAILVLDAVGEWNSGSEFSATWKNGRPEIKCLKQTKFPHSVGLFYSAMTDFLGFKPMNDECTLMALAAFGKPRYYDILADLLKITPAGEFVLPETHFDFHRFYKKPYTQKLIKLLGPPRDPQDELVFSSWQTQDALVDEEQQRFVDIAASVQKITEEIIMRQARHLLMNTGHKNLCFVGGVALNCVANASLLQHSGCENLFIPLDPGDGGAAIGAAYASYFSNEKMPSSKEDPIIMTQYPSCLGPTGSDQDLLKILPLLDLSHIQKYRQLNNSFKENLDWTWKTVPNQAELAEIVAQHLDCGKIVGWFQEQMELGPRALGQRSILIRPDNLSLANRLSKKVKPRAPFRPYALSMSLPAAKQLLIPTTENYFKQKPLEWMQLASSVNTDFHDQVQAGLHINGTTRPQIVKDQGQPSAYLCLLQAFGKRTGLECLLNTSFNEKDYPIVATPIEALMMFVRTDMDVLVINNLVILKSTKLSNAPL